MKNQTQADIYVAKTPSFYVLEPISERGKKWAENNVQVANPRNLPHFQIYVEYRYIDDILNAITFDGLSVESETGIWKRECELVRQA